MLSRVGVCWAREEKRGDRWEVVAHRECLSWETGVAGEKTGKHVATYTTQVIASYGDFLTAVNIGVWDADIGSNQMLRKRV